MIFYTSALFYVYVLIFFAKRTPVFLLPILIYPLVVFSTFRGLSGKDTPSYILRYLYSDTSIFNLDSEPFLNVLINLCRSLSPGEPALLFFVHSIIVVSFFYLICRKFELSRFYLLSVGPVFLIDGITNGMRVTLAYHILVLSYLYKWKILMYILGFMSHVTFVIGLIFKLIVNALGKGHRNALFLFAFFVCSILFGFLLFEPYFSIYFPRVFSKLNSYSTEVAKNSFSGLSDIYLIFSLLMVGSAYNRISYKKFFADLIVVSILCLGLFALASFSVAFLRVFKFIIIAICLSPFMIYSRRRAPSWLILLIGGLYVINFLRQIFFDHGFLPYGDF